MQANEFGSELVDIAAKELLSIATPGQGLFCIFLFFFLYLKDFWFMFLFAKFLFSMSAVTDVQLKRAKESTKAAVLMNLESRVCSLSLTHTYTESSCFLVLSLWPPFLLASYNYTTIMVLLHTHFSICCLRFGHNSWVFYFHFADDCIRGHREAGFDIRREVCNIQMEPFFPISLQSSCSNFFYLFCFLFILHHSGGMTLFDSPYLSLFMV